MAQEPKAERPLESLLQTMIDTELFERYQRERDRWGMTNKQMLTRILSSELPRWEGAAGPPVQPPAE